MDDLKGRRALVTGAARRVGRAIALALAGAGVDCRLHYSTSEAEAGELAAACRAQGVAASLLRADLRDPEAVDALADAAGEVDLLIHNASAFDRTPFLATDAATHRERLRRDLALHVEAPYMLARRLGVGMVARGFGRIVVIGDAAAPDRVTPAYAPYLVSKSAVPTLVATLAVELGLEAPGVTANAILPGPMLPPEGDHPHSIEMVRRQTVAGRWLGAEAIAEAVLYLARSSEVTGSSLRVDGGRGVRSA